MSAAKEMAKAVALGRWVACGHAHRCALCAGEIIPGTQHLLSPHGMRICTPCAESVSLTGTCFSCDAASEELSREPGEDWALCPQCRATYDGLCAEEQKGAAR